MSGELAAGLPAQPRSAAEWDQLAKDAERDGDLLGAYDRALRGLAEHPDDVELRYRAVLNLSRSGANDRAAVLLAEYHLDDSDDERIRSLGARVLREQGLVASGPAARALLSEAARRYRRVYAQTGGTFPGINAATLTLLAGDAALARTIAGEVLDACRRIGIHDFGRASDAAAAALIVGDRAAVDELVRTCAVLHGGNFIAVAATRRQLARICDALHQDRALLAPLNPPMVIHYTGHMISPPSVPGRFPAEAEAGIASAIGAWLDAHPTGHGFGSLACGGDILVAEALLRRGAELHVVFPFAIDEFRAISVARGGDGWLARFDECLARAASATYATEDQYLGDNVLFGHCGRLAMGLALLRARYLDAPVVQLALWDGDEAGGEAGTSCDVAFWRGRGLSTDIIASPSTLCEAAAEPAPRASKRVVKAMLFGDAKGFGKLSDQQIPVFVEHVLGAIRRVLDRHGDTVEFRNTWGDGLYLVMRDTRSAMECALDLQAEIAAIDHAKVGLPKNLTLRIGGHAGPVFAVDDPVLSVRNYLGSHVSRTASMEPITPEGEVYVTEAFAALIALERDSALSCEYVGIVPAAKTYGSFRMYVLRRRQAGALA